MSGLEAVAAIMGIASAGLTVSATLYNFASTASGAKEDMRTIAESIDTYSSVLETLGRQLEASQAVCSPEGVRLAVDLQRQSQVLFEKISENIPLSTAQGPSIGQKLTWYFNRDRVAFLLGQIEQLKATVSLLLQILILAQTTKPVKSSRKININVNVINADISSQFRRAENRVIQYHSASQKLARLQIEDEPVIRNALPWQEEIRALSLDDDPNVVEEVVPVAQADVLRHQHATVSIDDTHANSAQLVNMLLDHWTTVETALDTTDESSEDDPEGQGDHDETIIPPQLPASNVISRQDRNEDSRIASESSSKPNPVKGWWQKFRHSQKSKEEQDRISKELQGQEKEMAQREARLEREQSLIDRELKLQEAERKKQVDHAKALSEKQTALIEAQRLKEESQKQSQAERELKAQNQQRQKEQRREHASRVKAIRQESKIARKYGARPPQLQQSGHTIERGASSTGLSAPEAASSTSNLSSPSMGDIENAPQSINGAPPAYSVDDPTTAQGDRSLSPASLGQRSRNTSVSNSLSTGPDKILSDLHHTRASLKQQRKERKLARKNQV